MSDTDFGELQEARSTVPGRTEWSISSLPDGLPTRQPPGGGRVVDRNTIARIARNAVASSDNVREITQGLLQWIEHYREAVDGDEVSLLYLEGVERAIRTRKVRWLRYVLEVCRAAMKR